MPFWTIVFYMYVNKCSTLIRLSCLFFTLDTWVSSSETTMYAMIEQIHINNGNQGFHCWERIYAYGREEGGNKPCVVVLELDILL